MTLPVNWREIKAAKPFTKIYKTSLHDKYFVEMDNGFKGYTSWRYIKSMSKGKIYSQFDNPQMCEYCKVIHHSYATAHTPKEQRRALARLRLHKRVLHRNPPTPRRVKIARIAVKMAYRLYKKFKDDGVPQFIIDRIPAEVRPYVVMTLEASGVKVVKRNPQSDYQKKRAQDVQLMRYLLKGGKLKK